MAEISAADVMKLRKMSGQGMMDCKKALNEAEGDVEKAMGILRKKGLATLSKRADRNASEGLVLSIINEDGKIGILTTLCCETDFVTKSDDFVAATKKLLEYAKVCEANEGAGNILKTSIDGKTFEKVLTDTVSITGEKMEVGDFVRYEVSGSGFVSVYIHFNKKVGTMVEVETSDDTVAANAGLKSIVNDIAMHIAAVKPVAVDKNGLDSDDIEKEKAIYIEQVKGKPENIIDKIVEGKLNKYYSENCLISQAFVKDDSKTVEQVLTESAKAAGGEVKIKRFVRFELG